MSRNLYERPLAVSGLLASNEDLVTVKSNAGLPPGSRVVFSLQQISSEPIELQGKIVHLSKTNDGAFAVQVRLHGLSKADKAAMEKLM